MPYDQVAGEVNPELLKEGIAESNASLDLHKKEEEAAALTQEKEKN